MALRLYNTMGRCVQDFVPIKEGFAGFYGCGPTVYNYAHIGNLRAYVFLDTLDRTLSYLGYEIRHVMNITDIGHLTGDADDGDDKMLRTAQERHQSVLEVARFYTDAFFMDIDRLNVRRPDVVCRATEHVDEMIALIRRIEANGHTYMAGGNLYYDVTTFSDYGRLANLNLDELRAGAGKRDVVVVDENKRNPHDFVLWFTRSKFEEQALTWDSPWGRGYPGWHIECSAMSMKYLGEHFDIHTGGIDHIPVHHTNEIAQSEGATGRKWVNYWLHNEFLVLNDGKMSKSGGNFLTLQSLVDKGYDALDYRFFLLGGHYRSQLSFSWDSMDSARNARRALVQRVAKLLASAGSGCTYPQGTAQPSCKSGARTEGLSRGAAEYVARFTAALESDLATPRALSVLQKAVRDGGLSPAEAVRLIGIMDSVLGLRLEESASALNEQKSTDKAAGSAASDEESAVIQAKIEERAAAKNAKDWARADAIRAELAAQGIILVDSPQGTVWHRA